VLAIIAAGAVEPRMLVTLLDRSHRHDPSDSGVGRAFGQPFAAKAGVLVEVALDSEQAVLAPALEFTSLP
jgi:hypothetical protein